jgi:hypothetical protein
MHTVAIIDPDFRTWQMLSSLLWLEVGVSNCTAARDVSDLIEQLPDYREPDLLICQTTPKAPRLAALRRAFPETPIIALGRHEPKLPTDCYVFDFPLDAAALTATAVDLLSRPNRLQRILLQRRR